MVTNITIIIKKKKLDQLNLKKISLFPLYLVPISSYMIDFYF